MNTQPQPFSQSTPVILYGQYARPPVAIDWQQQTASFDISCVNRMRLVRKFDQLAALNPDIVFNTPEAPKQPLEMENISSMVDNTQSTMNAVSEGTGEAQDTNTAAVSERVLMTVEEARDFVATYEPPATPDDSCCPNCGDTTGSCDCSDETKQRASDYWQIAQRDFEREIYKQVDAEDRATEVTPDNLPPIETTDDWLIYSGDDEDYVEGDDDHDGWIDPDAGVQDDEPILSIMAHEPPTDSPAMPVTISDLKDIAGYVPVVDLHVPVRRLDDRTISEVIQDYPRVVGYANELQEGTKELRNLLKKANQERDALRAVIDAIRVELDEAKIETVGHGMYTMSQADRVHLLVEREKWHTRLMLSASKDEKTFRAERDQLKTQRDAILTSARQHKAALKTLQAKVRDAITSGNLDLLKDATE